MILTIIQARMSSTRLPGKIIMPIAGKPILQHVIDAAPEPKIIAMPFSDQEIMLKRGHLSTRTEGGTPFVWYKGDENDVLDRFYSAWYYFDQKADWILRLTADCPMLTREIVKKFLERCNKDFFSWYPDTIYTNRPWDPDGYDCELFSVEALKLANKYATDSYDQEHCTAWMYRNLCVARFSIFDREPQPENPAEKVSIDTLDDYEKVKKLMEEK